jgi:hypothetical protein
VELGALLPLVPKMGPREYIESTESTSKTEKNALKMPNRIFSFCELSAENSFSVVRTPTFSTEKKISDRLVETLLISEIYSEVAVVCFEI